jgi:hypothetical protein
MLRAALCMLYLSTSFAMEITLPKRPSDAPTGSAFAHSIANLDLAAREGEIIKQVENGNVPDFWRHFVKVGAYWVAPDYFAIGSDEDYFLAPITPMTARIIGQKIDCTLPTPALVDEIYSAAKVKLIPNPIPPSPEMTTVPVFLKHNETVRQQLAESREPLGALVAGHKKDVVHSDVPGKVAIYGWHQPNGKPIQPLYSGHNVNWVDYSHGIRFVRRANEELRFEPGVRIVIDQPANLDGNKPERLVLYALPNGNTIEQTMGRRPSDTNDWRYDIQHIAAQTRWLRQHALDANLIVAYLACAEKSWPAWRRTHDPKNEKIPEIVDLLRKRFNNSSVKVILTGHSGGGSFIFGYLNGTPEVPNFIERIAFLDSNYAYTTEAEKLARWLKADQERYLCVLAYHDSIALLNGKTFVSENGGTWGRSHAMVKDLSAFFIFESNNDSEWQRSQALKGRVQFLLKENPAKAILHTRQVELNGFIHAMLMGTELENKGYTYFAPRAYEQLIER